MAPLILAAAAMPDAGAAPETFNTALPVGRGEALLRAQVNHVRATGDPAPAARALTVRGVSLVAAWGATARWTLFGVVPWLDKRREAGGPASRITRETRGAGDARLLARYTGHVQDGPGRTFRVAPYAGIEAPTGDHDRRDALGMIPRPLQPGSGSWDPLLGVVITDQSLAREWGADASYKFNNRAAGFEFGDEARLNLSYHARIGTVGMPGEIPRFVYAGLEGNLVWRDKDRSGGVVEPDSGGTTFYLAPVLQYVTVRTVTGAAVRVPVAQHLNGDAVEEDYSATVSLRVNF